MINHVIKGVNFTTIYVYVLYSFNYCYVHLQIFKSLIYLIYIKAKYINPLCIYKLLIKAKDRKATFSILKESSQPIKENWVRIWFHQEFGTFLENFDLESDFRAFSTLNLFGSTH